MLARTDSGVARWQKVDGGAQIFPQKQKKKKKNRVGEV